MTFDRDHYSPEVYDARDVEFFFENGRFPWRRWDLFEHLVEKFSPYYGPTMVDFLCTLSDEELVEAHCNMDDRVPEVILQVVKDLVGRRLLYRSLEVGMEN